VPKASIAKWYFGCVNQEEQHTLVRFLWVKVIKVAEIHKKMLVQYDDSYRIQQKACVDQEVKVRCPEDESISLI
jgi:hypothetical protein